MSVPQRKKYDLCFTDKHLYARAPGTSAPVQGISYTWADIGINFASWLCDLCVSAANLAYTEYAFYLPVPEKAQVQHNYVLFPRGTAFPSKTDPPAIEPLVFTVPSTAPKHGTVEGPKAGAAAALSDTYRALFDWALTIHLSAASNPTTIVAADPAKFHSVARQAHRPNEKAVHIKAFRGSKDGYIFFLPNGILWGFKKPLLFMPLERIAAVSYTSVLQRTFNVVVEVFTGEGDVTEEVEFSMLDQEDYQGIDELYVKRNRLQDRSMAEQRRAKMELLENQRGKKGDENGAAAAANGGVGPDGMTELERAHAEAEQEMQDEEDEDEEDYDPGSEGESEGEGETSEEEDEDGEGEEGDEEEEEEEDGDQDGEGDLDTA